ncbi:MAG TPA: Gmad2 immunoglobulin-like domain-containing protein [Anaerolineales bacterium]|nr:Gmad2 immunoglobulin-like domain-containing protein [Anaerolineales bacterium]
MAARHTLILLFTVLLIGCRPATPTPTAAPVNEATATPAAPAPTPNEQAMSIRDAEYQLGLPDSLQVIQLAEGKFERGTPGGADFVSVQLTDFAAAGDLDGDGSDEVAALVSENYGGTGVFVFLVVYSNVNGQPAYLTSAIVDDRPLLNALSIEDNEVFLDATIHGPDEPMCCPTLRTTRHYRLVNNQLDMTDFTTFTPDGAPRTITIEAPVNGTEVFSTVQVRGNVAIAPFENNLTYSIKDVGGVELYRGALQVTSPDLGAPGTFEATIPLGNILSTAVIILEVQDVSAADGSLLAMDSVELVVK